MLKLTALFALILFLLATALSLRLDGASDGYTTVGFPVTFWKQTSGKCGGCEHYFHWMALGGDFLTTALCALVGVTAWRTATVRNN